MAIADDVNGEFHLCVTALTADGQSRILYAVRHADGTADGFQDVSALLTFSGSFISIACAVLNKELHLCGVTDDGKLWHTVRSAQNDWLPFEDVKALSTNDPGLSQMSASLEEKATSKFSLKLVESYGTRPASRNLQVGKRFSTAARIRP